MSPEIAALVVILAPLSVLVLALELIRRREIRRRKAREAREQKLLPVIEYNEHPTGTECAAHSRCSPWMVISSACNVCGHAWCYNIDGIGCNACQVTLKMEQHSPGS